MRAATTLRATVATILFGLFSSNAAYAATAAIRNSSAANRIYTVAPGNTLFKIAKKYNVSLSSLEKANPRAVPANLLVGTELVIPFTASHAASTSHVISTVRPTSTSMLATNPREAEQAVIHTAESFMGIPYVWGGDTPRPGFDCSGFVHYVYSAHGVNLPRTAHQQAIIGTPVAKSHLRPGDLLFFSNTDSYARDYANHVTHVGIYLGGGNMIESTSVGDKGVAIIKNVFKRRFYVSHFYGARRVIR